LPAKYGERAERVAQLPLAKWNQRELPHMTRFLDEKEKSQLWPEGENQDSERVLAELYASVTATDPLQQVLSVYQAVVGRRSAHESRQDEHGCVSRAAHAVSRLSVGGVSESSAQPREDQAHGTEAIRNQERSATVRRAAAAARNTHTLEAWFPRAREWLVQNGLGKWARGVLRTCDARMFPGFSAKPIDELILRAEQGAGDAPGKVWLLIVLEFWLQAWDARIT
jgi:hypothetical protein